MEITLNINRRSVLKFLGLAVLLGIVWFGGFVSGVSMTYPVAKRKGYEAALTDVATLLKQEGIDLQWEYVGDGKYTIQVFCQGKLKFQTTFEIHMLVEHYRNGKLVSRTYHPMTVVDQGKDWVEQQLFSPSSTEKAVYIACSNDSSSVDTGWQALPGEITTDGLARAEGTYTSTGVGAANITKEFSVTGSNSTKLYGIYYSGSGNTLIAAEQQGTANQKNVESGDTLKITVQWSHG